MNISNKQNTYWSRIASLLFAAVGLAATGGVAAASIYSEPLDFSDFTPDLLPVGATGVHGRVATTKFGRLPNGTFDEVPDERDWVQFQGLVAGGSYDADYSFVVGNSQVFHPDFEVYLNATGGQAFGQQIFNNGSLIGHGSFIAPSNGKVDVLFIGFCCQFINYDFTLTQTADPPPSSDTPETSTFAACGIAASGLLGWRRIRKQASR